MKSADTQEWNTVERLYSEQHWESTILSLKVFLTQELWYISSKCGTGIPPSYNTVMLEVLECIHVLGIVSLFTEEVTSLNNRII